MDLIIAKDQIDRYFKNGMAGIDYVTTLSVDAAPQISRLLQSDDESIKEKVHDYFNHNNEYYNNRSKCWQQWNLAINKFQNKGSTK